MRRNARVIPHPHFSPRVTPHAAAGISFGIRMKNGFKIAVVIPALNEERSIGKVIREIPGWVDDIVVVDNGSTDQTPAAAVAHGARVVREPRRGYGFACLAGIAALNAPDVIVFLDGDYSDYPAEMGDLVDPIVNGEADLISGSRVLGNREFGALTPQARFGNWLSCLLIRRFWKAEYTDLGPFRAIRATTLESLGMRDPTYGWVVEMQIKATQRRFRVREVPANYRRRIGKSKVSGTVKGVIGAGTKILAMIFQLRLAEMTERRPPHAERLILFTRFPTPGRAKTRLIPKLGPEGAAALHRELTEHAVRRVWDAKVARNLALDVRHADGAEREMRNWLGAHLDFRPQSDGDLGQRMATAFAEAFAAGARRVVIIGSDCPDLTSEIVCQAFAALETADLVLGPAADGGYYLIGLRRTVPELFQGVAWGGDAVFETTLRIARTRNLSVVTLATLADVDRPEDLPIWESARQAEVHSTPDNRAASSYVEQKA
jgi:rSAM/selenodomain-associated transferase 1